MKKTNLIELMEHKIECNIKIPCGFKSFHDFVYFNVDLNEMIANFCGLIFDEYYKVDLQMKRSDIERYAKYTGFKSIKNGSIIITIVSAVAGGLILKFLDRKLFSDNNRKVEINIRINNNISMDREARELIDDLLEKSDSNVETLVKLLKEKGIVIPEEKLKYLKNTTAPIKRISKITNSLELSKNKERGKSSGADFTL